MANIQGSFTYGDMYQVSAAAPLDVRTVVETVADLTATNSWNEETHRPYKGMVVSVEETGDLYILIDETKVHEESGWKKQGGLDWVVIDPSETPDPERPLYLQTTKQTLDESVKKQVIENLGLDTKLDDKLEATVVGSGTTISEFPVLLAGHQELSDSQKQQVRANLGMEDYINTLIDDAIGSAIDGGY